MYIDILLIPSVNLVSNIDNKLLYYGKMAGTNSNGGYIISKKGIHDSIS
jgi:hypothetical protein